MRAADYPVPDYACYCWHNGDALVVGLPDSGTYFIQLDKWPTSGHQFLLRLLADRRRDYQAGKKPTIGMQSEPTQQMVEEFLKRRSASEKASREICEDIFAEEDSDND